MGVVLTSTRHAAPKNAIRLAMLGQEQAAIDLRGSVCSAVAVVGTTSIALCVASDYDHLQHSPAATELTPYHWRRWPTLNTMMFTHKLYRRAVCRHVAGKQRPS